MRKLTFLALLSAPLFLFACMAEPGDSQEPDATEHGSSAGSGDSSGDGAGKGGGDKSGG